MDSRKIENMLVLLADRIAILQASADVILQSQAALTAFATGEKDYAPLEQALRASVEYAANQYRQTFSEELRALIGQTPPSKDRN